MPNVRSLVRMLREVLALVRAARADAAARHAHGDLVRGARRRRGAVLHASRSRSARCTRSGVTCLVVREVEQLAQHVLRRLRRARAGDAEVAAAAADLHAEPLLDQAQVLVERTAQVGEARVVRRLELEFARSGWSCGH